jgi:group I intron endonuclease
MIQNRLSGIYQILNVITGKSYVGSSIDICHRRMDHFCRLKSGTHVNAYLQKAWNKYGAINFSFFVLEQCALFELEKREYFWIKKLKSDNRSFGYNLLSKCDRNVYLSQETILKKSLSAKKLWGNEEFKKKTIKSLKKNWVKRDPERLRIIKESGIRRRNMIPVAEYSLTGELLRKFACRRDAYLQNNRNRDIYRALSGVIKTCRGKIYRYLEPWPDTHLKGQKALIPRTI